MAANVELSKTRHSEQRGYVQIAFAICATGLLIFLIGAGAAVVLSRVPQPGYVFLLPAIMVAVGLFYAARGLVYLLKH
jgi:hypothetical protein